MTIPLLTLDELQKQFAADASCGARYKFCILSDEDYEAVEDHAGVELNRLRFLGVAPMKPSVDDGLVYWAPWGRVEILKYSDVLDLKHIRAERGPLRD